MNSSNHFNDACYDVWRRGGNPDRVDPDRSENDYYDGRDPEYTANREIERQENQRQRRRDLEEQEKYY